MTSHSNAILVIHGGAGVHDAHDYSKPAAFMAELLARGGEALRGGRPALELVADMVAGMEESGLFTAGKGSAPNQAGEVELDASIMDGMDRACGAVAAVRNVVNPIRLALSVLRDSPHVMLAGNGAERFADAQQLARVSDASAYYRAAIEATRRAGAADAMAPLTHGTVGAVALDDAGRLAAATSTGGTINKLPGRVGDTPLIGAATWADDQLAVSCTGQGEFFIRVCAAHDVAARMAYQGASVEAASQAVIDAVGKLGGDGGLIAIDRHGNVAMPFNSGGMKRGVVRLHGEPKIDIY